MTKNELTMKMVEFINSLDNYIKDEWYDTERGIAAYVLERFAIEEFNIDLPKFLTKES